MRAWLRQVTTIRDRISLSKAFSWRSSPSTPARLLLYWLISIYSLDLLLYRSKRRGRGWVSAVSIHSCGIQKFQMTKTKSNVTKICFKTPHESEHEWTRVNTNDYEWTRVNTSDYELEHEWLRLNTSEHKSKYREHESKIVKNFIKNVIATK